jgi:hypothetical protein
MIFLGIKQYLVFLVLNEIIFSLKPIKQAKVSTFGFSHSAEFNPFSTLMGKKSNGYSVDLKGRRKNSLLN